MAHSLLGENVPVQGEWAMHHGPLAEEKKSCSLATQKGGLECLAGLSGGFIHLPQADFLTHSHPLTSGA